MDRHPEKLEDRTNYNIKMILENVRAWISYKNGRVKVTTSCESGNKQWV
jgi:hypothetical protein